MPPWLRPPVHFNCNAETMPFLLQAKRRNLARRIRFSVYFTFNAEALAVSFQEGRIYAGVIRARARPYTRRSLQSQHGVKQSP
ncbi:hypothetical protein R3P38DRAFT_3207214 [Favolaschia claudopus]|uniref:Uncharacterized protein n=1 Tax=Favolaschia claudopus TaxID=2862362 RepID=A0AAW0AKE3_9AGAR